MVKTINFTAPKNSRRERIRLENHFPQLETANKTGSSQVGAIYKAQKYSRNNYWKHLQKIIFKKIIFEIFFETIIFLSRTMLKNSKRGHSGSLNVFTNRKLQKKCKGYPLIESVNF